jgi:hypothetical protein
VANFIPGLTGVVYALVSMWEENRFGWPLRGIIWFTAAAGKPRASEDAKLWRYLLLDAYADSYELWR